MRRTTTLSLAVLVCGLTFGACGSDLVEGAAPSTVALGSQTTFNPYAEQLRCSAPGADGKPPLYLPRQPARHVQIVDNKIDSGPKVDASSEVTVNYMGCGQLTKLQFDSSWDRGEYEKAKVSDPSLVWTLGVLGMKVGGRRTITVPGTAAFGPKPASPDIRPNETVVFIVDLIAIKPPPDAQILSDIAARGRPTAVVPRRPAADLVSVDNIVGNGRPILAGSQVVMHYSAFGQIGRREVDTTWNNNQPLEIDVDRLFTGFRDGLQGMKVGGRRTITIPGAMAYADKPPSADIRANETIIIVVDLIAVYV